MKYFKSWIANIPITNIEKNLTSKIIEESLKNSKLKEISNQIKILCISLVSTLICSISYSNGILLPLCSTSIIFFSLIFYFKTPIFLKQYSLNFVIYINIQTILIFYIASINVSNNITLNKSVALLYVLISYTILIYYMKNKLKENLYKRYFPQKKNC